MPITSEERAVAKKAYGEIRNCDACRVIIGLYLVVLSLYFLLFLTSVTGMIPVFSDGKYLRGWEAGLPILSMFTRSPFVFILLLFAAQLINYLRLRPRCTVNRKIVTELEQKHAGELPYGLENEIQKENSNSRAILWRIDAFLSRKPIKK